MLQEVYQLVELRGVLSFMEAFSMNNKDSLLSPYYSQFDKSKIENLNSEIWIIVGPGLGINGSYSYQKSHTKEEAQRFLQLINNVSCESMVSLQNAIKNVMGIK